MLLGCPLPAALAVDVKSPLPVLQGERSPAASQAIYLYSNFFLQLFLLV